MIWVCVSNGLATGGVGAAAGCGRMGGWPGAVGKTPGVWRGGPGLDRSLQRLGRLHRRLDGCVQYGSGYEAKRWRERELGERRGHRGDPECPPHRSLSLPKGNRITR